MASFLERKRGKVERLSKIGYNHGYNVLNLKRRPSSMSLDKGTKEEITKKFQLHEKDTGSADVQIAILTERIAELTEHLKIAPKDHSSRLALLKLVGQRRKLLDYLNSTDTKRYQTLIVRLNLRK